MNRSRDRARTAPGSPPPVMTGQHGSGTAATGRAARRPHRPHRLGDGRRDRPGRHLARHRAATTRQRGSGTPTPATTRHPHRPHQAGERLSPSPRTAPGSPPAARTRQRGSGTPTPASKRAILTGHTDTVTAVAIAPDGTWLATASSDETARIWDAGHRRSAPSSTGHTDVDGGRDRPGRHLARHRRHTTGRCGSGIAPSVSNALMLTGQRAPVIAVAIAPDGTWLATASGDRDGADLGSRHRPASMPPSPATPARCTAVAIAPDGSWLATASYDGTARIWEPSHGAAHHPTRHRWLHSDGSRVRPGRHLARHRQP